MENNKKFFFKTLSVSELKNLKLHTNNRCGEVEREKALKNYTDFQYESFIKRCHVTLKEIKKKGYNPTSHLIIAKCSEDNQYYLIEGQGRRGAIILGIENNEINVSDIPCMIFDNPMTYEQIGEEIIKHNTQKSQNPWKSNDIAFSKARHYGGEIEEAFKFQVKYQERLSMINKPYMARLMLYGGNKASHLRDNDCGFTMEDFRADYELFMDIYEYFVNNFGRSEIRKRYKSKVRNQDLGIVYESFFNRLYNIVKSKGLSFDYVRKVNNALCKWSCKVSLDAVDLFLKIKKNEKIPFLNYCNMECILMEVFPKGEITINDFADWKFGANKIKKCA